MSVVATCLVSCTKPERYIQQLVSHWGHKLETGFDAGTGTGTFVFSDATDCTMLASRSGIEVTLRTADITDNLRMRDVIARHLDRFAFREAPLAYAWVDQ